MIFSFSIKRALLVLGFVAVCQHAAVMSAAVPVPPPPLGAVPCAVPATKEHVEAMRLALDPQAQYLTQAQSQLELGKSKEKFATYVLGLSAVVGGADLLLSYRSHCKKGAATWGFKGFAAFAWSKLKDASGLNGWKGFKNKPVLSACLYVCLVSGIFKGCQRFQNKKLNKTFTEQQHRYQDAQAAMPDMSQVPVWQGEKPGVWI